MNRWLKQLYLRILFHNASSKKSIFLLMRSLSDPMWWASIPCSFLQDLAEYHVRLHKVSPERWSRTGTGTGFVDTPKIAFLQRKYLFHHSLTWLSAIYRKRTSIKWLILVGVSGVQWICFLAWKYNHHFLIADWCILPCFLRKAW